MDRAVTRAHDIGIRIVRNGAGEIGYEVAVGGGLGRTPVIGTVIRDFLPEADFLPYVESILQVYNAIGRRDNKFKARIKITVGEHGIEAFRERVEERFRLQRKGIRGGGPGAPPGNPRDVRGAGIHSRRRPERSTRRSRAIRCSGRSSTPICTRTGIPTTQSSRSR